LFQKSEKQSKVQSPKFNVKIALPTLDIRHWTLDFLFFRIAASGQLFQGDKNMATSAEWHESYDQMSEQARNFSRAVKSVQEELEAVDWYNQRAQATGDEQLRRILEHNRDEEIEHAMMGLEYLRRINPVFDKHMRTYLFTEGDITEIEEQAEK
jgi:uncharacterized protein